MEAFAGKDEKPPAAKPLYGSAADDREDTDSSRQMFARRTGFAGYRKRRFLRDGYPSYSA